MHQDVGWVLINEILHEFMHLRNFVSRYYKNPHITSVRMTDEHAGYITVPFLAMRAGDQHHAHSEQVNEIQTEGSCENAPIF